MRRTACRTLLPLLLAACAAPSRSQRPRPPAASTAPAPAAPTDPVPAAPVPAAPTVPVPSASPAPAPSAPDSWQPVLLPAPAIDSPSDVLVQDGVERMVRGGRRFERQRSAVRIAADATLHEIVALAARREGGWWFATEDGTLWSAPSFLGPLTSVAAAGRALVGGRESREVLVAFDRRGGHLFGSAAGWRDAVPLTEGPLLAASFADPGFGLLVETSGRLLRVGSDGPATLIPLGDVVPYDVRPEGDGLLVATTEGAVRIDRDGRKTPVDDPARMPSRWSDEADSALRASDPLRYFVALADARVVLADGSALQETGGRFEAQSHRLVSPSGTARSVRNPGEGCDLLLAAGATLVAKCADREGVVTVRQWRDDGRWRRLRTISPESTLLAGEDGAIAVHGGCNPDNDDETHVCWFDGVRWTDRGLAPQPDTVVQIHDVRRDALLYSLQYPDDVTRFFVKASAGDPVPVVLDRDDVQLQRVRLTGEGLVAVHASDGNGPTVAHFAAVGRPGEPLPLRPLPAGAESVAFVDGERGLAAGRRLSHAWSTLDGGVHWTPLALTVPGDVRGVESRQGPATDDLLEGGVRCTSTFCAAGLQLLWLPRSLAGAVAPRVLAPAVAPPDLLNDPPEPPPAPRFATWRCAVPTVGAPSGALAAPQGWLWSEPPPVAAAGAGRYRLRWVGADAQGTFRGATQTTELPQIERATEFLPRWGAAVQQQVVPVHLARQFVVVQRCIGTERMGSGVGLCDLIVIDAAGRASMLTPRMSALEGVLTLPDGGVALRTSESSSRRGRTVYPLTRVWWLDARGALAGTRAFAVSERGQTSGTSRFEQVLLAADGRVPGLAVRSTRDAEAWMFYPLDPARSGRRLPSFQRATMAPCANDAPSPSTVTLLRVTPGGSEPGIGFRAEPRGSLSEGQLFVLELGADGALCLRARLLRPLPGRPPQWPIVIRAERGTVRGSLLDASGASHEVSCTLEPPR